MEYVAIPEGPSSAAPVIEMITHETNGQSCESLNPSRLASKRRM